MIQLVEPSTEEPLQNELSRMILVTGATGLLGSQLIRELIHNGHTNIRGLKRKSSNLKFVKDIQDQVEWFDADILDVVALEEAFKGITKVYHCAAIVSFDPNMRDIMYQTNVEGTANVVNLAIEQEVQKLVHVSSIAALGRAVEGVKIDENIEWEDSNENSWYAVTKYNAEMEVWRGVAEGLNVGVVNPSIILGKGNWSNDSSAFFKIIWKGMPFFPCGSNGFVDVHDVAKAMVRIMESPINNERYILNGADLKYEALFNTIAKHLKKKPSHIKITPLIGAIGWRVEKIRAFLKGKMPVITKETVRTTSKNYSYDSSKIKNEVGFEFKPMEETLARISNEFLADIKS